MSTSNKINVIRQWIGTGTSGRLKTYTEQRYISKHSMSYHDYVHFHATWLVFQQRMEQDIITIGTALEQLPDTVTTKKLKKVLNSTSTFTTDKTSDNLLTLENLSDNPLILQQNFKKRCIQIIRKCCNGAVLLLSWKSNIGDKAPIKATTETIQDLEKQLIKWALLLLPKHNKVVHVENTAVTTSQGNNSKLTGTKQSLAKTTVLTKLNIVVSIDFEWQMDTDNAETDDIGEVKKHKVKHRGFDDVLSCQYVIFIPDYPDIDIHGVIFNSSPRGFNFKQLIIKFIDIVQHEFNTTDENNQPILLDLKKLNLLLTGYFLGVDFSCTTGWNKLPIHLIVQGKHKIFSTRPYPLYINRRGANDGIKVSLTVRDTASIAPMGGLKKLGEIVNQPKIDVTKQDAIDFATHKIGLADYCRYLNDGGYYKNNMQLLLQRHFNLYVDYALNDSIIAMKYLRMFVKTFKLNWNNFNKLPPTTTNNSIKPIAKLLEGDCVNQRIFDSQAKFSDIRENPLHNVRNYYRDLYIAATEAYIAGFNVAFSSLVLFLVNVVDTDLASAYPVAAALMSVPDYSKPRSTNTLKYLFNNLTSIDERSNITFEKLYQHLKQGKGFPFLLGVCLVDIDYPDDYQGIITTPQRSETSGNPVFVKHLESKWITLVDAIDAHEHGAKVTLHAAEIPSQHWNGYNAWASVQLKFVADRNKAKAERDKYSKDNKQYKKYDAIQTLYKLASNVIYGGAAQAVLPKSTRNYLTNKTEEIKISKVSDPVIAGTYTAITRYLVHNLYDAVSKVYGDNVQPLNITTDGYTFAIPQGQKFDFDSVNKVFNEKLSDFYRERLKKNGFPAGFVRKGNTTDTATTVFNLRTRLNGTPNLKSLDAMGGIADMTPTKLWPTIERGQVVLENKARRFSNLTDMKFGTKRSNHQSGVMFEWEQQVNVPLQYDCAYKPDKWVDNRWDGYGFTAVPFNTVNEHDEWKSHSKLLTDRWNIMQKKEFFDAYMYAMQHYTFSRTAKTLDDYSYRDRVTYVLNKLKDPATPTVRGYKNTLYRTQQALKDNKKLPICTMAIYNNQRIK